MKEIASVATNASVTATAEGLVTMVEVILVVSEPEYVYAGGELSRHRVASSFRFSASVESLRKLAELLKRHADEADSDIKGAMVAHFETTKNNP